MATLPALRPIAVVAATNAAVQGLVGVVLGVLALCVCFCALGAAPLPKDDDFLQYLSYYLQGQECGGDDYFLYHDVSSPTALRVWFALGLFCSVFMMVSSVVLFIAVCNQWSDEKLQITLVTWLFINFFTAIDDLILGYVFGTDYQKALESSTQEENVGPLTLGIVTFLALRGGYLWVLNIAFIIYLFMAARALHKHLNERVPGLDQEPIESWPTLDDFGTMKGDGWGSAEGADIRRFSSNHTPAAAVNPRLAERLENGFPPEHSAMARWPSLNGQAQTMRVTSRHEPERERERRPRTVREREHSMKRQDGFDNQAYEPDSKYLVRLQNEVGSTQDYEEVPRRRERGRGSQQWDLPKDQDRTKREVSVGSSTVPGQYKQRGADPWKPPPPPSKSDPIPIPPVDYLDEPRVKNSRTLSLQEAILDRTLRLKKVPEELKRGIQNQK